MAVDRGRGDDEPAPTPAEPKPRAARRANAKAKLARYVMASLRSSFPVPVDTSAGACLMNRIQYAYVAA